MNDLVITLGADELLGLQALTKIDGGGVGAEAMAGRLLREALTAELEKAGLPWAPGNAVVTATSSDSEPPATLAGTPDAGSSPVTRRSGKDRLQAVVVAAGVIVLILLLVGGYGRRWSWTGFAGNGQVWDWLHLLLLPVALGTFPLWLRYADHMSRARKMTLNAALAAFAIFVAVGYLAPISWTGFQGNTLWNWLTLIALPLAIVTAKTWPSTKREVHAKHVVGGSILLVAWLITLIGGYAASWSWTGYQGNTLWDWMTLLLGPVAVTTVIAPAAVRWVSGDVERHVAEEEAAKNVSAPLQRA